MARSQSTDIRRTLRSLISTKRLEELAKSTGAIARTRKIGVVPLFWTVVLGFATGNARTLAGLRRAFQKTTGTTVVPSAFYDRFTKGLVRLLRAVLVDLVERSMRGRRSLAGNLAGFKDVLLSDSTVIRLHGLLERAFPACRTNHTKAALKAHVILSVTGAGPKTVKVTSERVHDGPVLRAGAWVQDRLLIFDLGYYRFQLFACIDREGGYFLTRLKDGANPLITAVHRTWRGRSVPLVGERLQNVIGRLQRQALDVEVELKFKHRSYRGRSTTGRLRVRLVGVRDERTGEYHLYVTNIPVDKLEAEDVAKTYAARWLIELAFRQLKSQYRVDQMPSRKRHIVEALLFAAFITFMVSRALQEKIRSATRQDLRERIRDERWAVLFASVSAELLALVLRRPSHARDAAPALFATLLRESVDPNRARLGLVQRAQAGIGYPRTIR
jgi:putative transposase